METSQTCIKNNSSIDNPSSLCDISPCVNNNEFHSPQNRTNKTSSSGIKKIAEGVNGEIFQTTNFFSRIYNACEIKSINKAHSEISSAFREYFCYLRKNKETFSNISNDIISKLKDCQEIIPPEILAHSWYCEDLQKRVPSINESVVATLTRFNTLNILDKFLDFSHGIVYGGSLSYGPFYNIRDGKDPSDIDLITIVDFSSLTLGDINFPYGRLFIKDESLELFSKRLMIFKERFANLPYNMCLSHKLDLKNEDFTISMHVISPTLWENMTGERLRTRLRHTLSDTEFVYDYREVYVNDTFSNLGSFDGKDYKVDITHKDVEEGKLYKVPLWIKDDDRFHTGQMQNLLVPYFEDYYAHNEIITKNLKIFKEILLSNMVKEETEPSFKNLANMNPRRGVFMEF